MLLCEWEQFLAILLYLHVTVSVFNSCDLFNTVSCYKFFRALIYCFIQLWRDLLGWRKYRFTSNIQFGILLSYIGVESFEEEEDFLEVFSTF